MYQQQQIVSNELIGFFEKYHHDQIFFGIPLNNLKHNLVNYKVKSIQQSLDIIHSILTTVIYIRKHMFQPSQIRPQHIYFNGQKWGVIYIICGRPTNKYTNKSNQIYNYLSASSKYHPSYQSELMWCIGSIWYQIVTNQHIQIQAFNQKQVNKQLDLFLNHQYLQIKQTIHKLLAIDINKRIKFQDLISTNLIIKNSIQKTINIKLLKYYNQCINNVHNQQVKNIQNPFLQHLLIRNMEQRVEIDKFIQKTKQILKQQFSPYKNPQYQQFQDQILLTLHIIDIQNYFGYKYIINNIQQCHLINVIKNDINLKKSYANFIYRKYQLEILIENTHKKFMEENLQIFKQNFTIAANPLNKIPQKAIYKQFKDYISTFLQMLQQNNSIQSSQNIIEYKKILMLLILRTSNYVFKANRLYVFQQLMSKKNNVIKVNSIIEQIEKCNDFFLLFDLYKRIQRIYFKPINFGNIKRTQSLMTHSP